MAMYVPLPKEAAERLRDLAREEKRRPQDQAAIIIERALGLRVERTQEYVNTAVGQPS